MQSLKQKLSENVLDKISMDFLRNQVLKNAYGNDDTVIVTLDPRVLLAWYLFFGLVPWFVNDIPFLLGCFLLVMVTTILARVAGLVLFLFAIGVFSQTGYLFVVTLLFGGGRLGGGPSADAHPEGGHRVPGLHHRLLRPGPGQALQRPDVVRLPGAAELLHLLRLPDAPHAHGGVPERVALLPPPGQSPAHETFRGKVRYLIYQVKIIMQSFYPLMLNTTKRSRTTVEALELRGYRYAAGSKSVKKLKLASLKVSCNDRLFPGRLLCWWWRPPCCVPPCCKKGEGLPCVLIYTPMGSWPKSFPFPPPIPTGSSGRPGWAGLDALCLTEHFNTLQFGDLYGYLTAVSRRVGDSSGAGQRPADLPRDGDRRGRGGAHPLHRPPGGHPGAEPPPGTP